MNRAHLGKKKVTESMWNDFPDLRKQPWVRALFLPAAWLGAAGEAHPQIHALGPGKDIAGAWNLTQMRLVRWRNNTATYIVGIDSPKKRLVLCSTDGLVYTTLSQVLMEDLPDNCELLLAELDEHNGPDVVLLAGDKGYAWTSGRRLTGGGPDIEFPLPREITGYPRLCAVADFDQDGMDDLLIPGTDSRWVQPPFQTPDQVVFSFGRSGAQSVEIPYGGSLRTSVAPPWTAGGPPVIEVETLAEGVPPLRIVGFSPERNPAIIGTSPTAGRLVELDGAAPPELLTFSYTGTTEEDFARTVELKKHTGDGWAAACTLVVPHYALAYEPPVSIADFNGSGRQQVIFSLPHVESLRNPYNTDGTCDFWAVQTTGGVEQSTLRTLPPGTAAAHRTEVIPVPGTIRSALVSYQPSSASTDLLGNPIFISGIGIRAYLRYEPLSLAHPHPTDPAVLRTPLSMEIGKAPGRSLPGVFTVTSRTEVQAWPDPLAPASSRARGDISDPDLTSSMILADLDGDGDDDPILAGNGKIQSLLAWDDHGSTHFAAATLRRIFTGTPPAPFRLLGTGDFDGDGDPDVLFLNSTDDTLSWIENSGDGLFGAVHPIALAGRGYNNGTYQWIGKAQTVITDADNDGDPDILTFPSVFGNRIALYRNTTIGFSLEALTPVIGLMPGDLGLLLRGRFLGGTDDSLQVALATAAYDINEMSRITVWGGSSAPLASRGSTDIWRTKMALAADFDGDGIDDFITTGGLGTDILGNPTGSPIVWWSRSRGDGSLEASVPIANPLGFPSDMRAADFDGDGRVDLAVSSQDTQSVEMFPHRTVPYLPDFDEWAQLFSPADPAPNADPDGDGRVNLLEWIAGTPPDSASGNSGLLPPAPGIPELRIPASSYFFYGEAYASHPRPRRPDGEAIGIDVELSYDLEHWSPIATTPSINTDPLRPEWEQLYWNIPTPPPTEQWENQPRAFYRFRATVPAK